ASAEREANRLPEALVLYQKALKLNPRWDEGWWYVGTIHYEADHYPEALAAFRNLPGLNPKLGPPWAMLGLCEFETGDYKNALIHLDRGRTLGLSGNEDFVNTPFIHYAYGSMLTRVSKYEEAEREFKEEIVTTPESALPYMQLAYIYLRVKRQTEALSLTRKAVELAPQSFVAHYLLGRTMLEQGDVARAIKSLEMARRLGPFSPEVRYNLALA